MLILIIERIYFLKDIKLCFYDYFFHIKNLYALKSKIFLLKKMVCFLFYIKSLGFELSLIKTVKLIIF